MQSRLAVASSIIGARNFSSIPRTALVAVNTIH
jgi:hypothetical protein